VAQLPGGRPPASALAGEDLAHLDYEAELALKTSALATFWRKNRLAGQLEAFVASPLPRGYRTTSKRRVDLIGSAAHLFLGDRIARRGTPVFAASSLEPDEHAEIYRRLQAKLSEHLGWIIVRGSYRERAVVFNIDMLSGPLVRKLKALGRHLAAGEPSVTAAFVYVAETGSDYYLEARRPKGSLDFKKLFGPESLRVAFGDLRLSFHPTSFSQVNESIVPQMLSVAGKMLKPRSDEYLIDLYCGYGLFSLALAGRVREVVGLDAAEPSIEAARSNARRLKHGRARFNAGRVSTNSVARLPMPGGDEIVVLDPPRNGTENGVIEAIAGRRPRRVLHIFCSVDEIPPALRKWKAAGYVPGRIVPLDMFPGTPNLEVFVELKPPAGR
jgi:tRNA/tmRNA/rRNA uracil-C5-methylase (TrmA/RlmC/RlmD family)